MELHTRADGERAVVAHTCAGVRLRHAFNREARPDWRSASRGRLFVLQILTKEIKTKLNQKKFGRPPPNLGALSPASVVWG